MKIKYKTYWYLTLLVFLLPLSVVADSYDNLLSSLKKAKSDTSRIQIYFKLGDYYKISNPDSAILFYEKALSISNENYNKDIVYKNLNAKSLRLIGLAYRTLDNFKEAIVYYKKAITICIETKNNKELSSCYNSLGVAYYRLGDFKNAEENYLASLKICLSEKDDQGTMNCYTNLGNINSDRGNFQMAIEYQKKALEISLKLKDQKRIATCYNNVGIVYTGMGDYNKAISNLLNALEISESLKDYSAMSYSYNNMAAIYYSLENYSKALEYYSMSIKICRELDYKSQLSDCYTNMGNVYIELSKLDTALLYYNKAIEIIEAVGDQNGLSITYSNIGNLFYKKGDYNTAIDYYKKSLKIDIAIGDTNGISTNYINLSAINTNLADSASLSTGQATFYLNESVKYGLKAFALSSKMGAVPLIKDASFQLYKSYLKLGKTSDALHFANIYITNRDSLFNNEINTRITEIEARYKFEKSQLEIDNLIKEKALQNETIARKDAESHRKSQVIYFLIGVFVIILVFSFIIYRLFIQKKKANILLAEQKYEIEEKNEELHQQNEEIRTQRDEIESHRDTVLQQKEVIENIHHELTDSIHYARRIQTAILPGLAIFANHKYNNFVIFKPRNIVSGDFYWATEVNNRLVFCVADCTGHGVPGAFMSMLGISLLNEIVKKEHISDAAQILNHLRENVINSLQQQGVSGEQKTSLTAVRDGMDISLCVLNNENLHLQFSGANNPLYIVTSQQSTVNSHFSTNCELPTAIPIAIGSRLLELKANKMPISIYPKMESFTNKEMYLAKGDSIYLFSDGMPDQFGGSKGRKFMYPKLQELFLSIAGKNMEKQKSSIENSLEVWMKGYEQVDDITILGINI